MFESDSDKTSSLEVNDVLPKFEITEEVNVPDNDIIKEYDTLPPNITPISGTKQEAVKNSSIKDEILSAAKELFHGQKIEEFAESQSNKISSKVHTLLASSDENKNTVESCWVRAAKYDVCMLHEIQ